LLCEDLVNYPSARVLSIADLTQTLIPPGSSILVEFDLASQWYNASTTIAAGLLKTGGSVSYVTQFLSPEDVPFQLQQLGLDTEDLERKGQLWIVDFYSASVEQKSKARLRREFEI
jgi:KaiC/GvpD/RAD55 family RecA-like ATPase